MSQSKEDEIGKVTVYVEGELKITWHVVNILSYLNARDSYCSETVCLPGGSQWHLAICSTGQSEKDCVEWISLYLYLSHSDTPSIRASFDLGVESIDGAITKTESELSHLFGENMTAYGYANFIDRRELQRMTPKHDLSGPLIFTCTLRLEDDLECISGITRLSKHFKNMFLSKKHCDVILRVKGEELSVHKSVLDSRCPEFVSKHKTELEETKTVEIENFEPKVVRDFSVFLYSGMPENFHENVFELYKLAVCNNVTSLMSDSVYFMLRNISQQNVLNVALLADTYGENKLQVKVQNFFNEHFEEIAITTTWFGFVKENPDTANKLLQNMAIRMKAVKE